MGLSGSKVINNNSNSGSSSFNVKNLVDEYILLITIIIDYKIIVISTNCRYTVEIQTQLLNVAII